MLVYYLQMLDTPEEAEVLREFLIVMRLLYMGLLRYLKILAVLYGCYMGKFVLYKNSPVLYECYIGLSEAKTALSNFKTKVVLTNF